MHPTPHALHVTIAHEIGHVLLGEGHPDDPEEPGPAPIPGIANAQTARRLMATGKGAADDARILVKTEWDIAENWMEINIDPE